MKITTARAHKPEKAPASKGKSGKGKHKIDAIHIRPASNGFIVEHDKPRPESTKDNPYPMREDAPPAAFSDHKSAHEHVGKLMAEMSGAPMETAADDAAAKPEEA